MKTDDLEQVVRDLKRILRNINFNLKTLIDPATQPPTCDELHFAIQMVVRITEEWANNE